MELAFYFSIMALIFSILAICASFAALVMILALKNSTHRIEWRPYEGSENNLNLQFNKKIEEIEEDFL